MKNRCIIIGAYKTKNIRELVNLTSDDYIICADGGYIIAQSEKINPDILIGDFDSMPENMQINCETVKLPKEKDDTDTLVCLKYGIEKGFNDFVIIGSIGGRLDHTLANIQTLAYACDNSKNAYMCDESCYIKLIKNDSLKINNTKDKYISLFSYSQECKGVNIHGVKYVLNDATLTNNFPLGVSNESVEDEVNISVKIGSLLIIVTDKNI